MRFFILGLLFVFNCTGIYSNPINGLLERIDKGSSKKFKIELVDENSDVDFFELDQYKDKIVIRGNTYSSVGAGLNWYLKYYANIHLSWNCMKAELPKKLPPVYEKVRKETDHKIRYYLNYCTFSYSMAFWDWERWQQEIDWMVLHGINLSLAITGTELVWYNMLKELNYTDTEIDNFIAGPAFLAWWQMNNLEGWGGPNPKNWYEYQYQLQKQILTRYREFGIEPALPGYAGMLPNGSGDKLDIDITDPGLWCGFKRPAFLQTTDPSFEKIADLYYKELTNLYGISKYYAFDPFHEGGSTKGVNLKEAGDKMFQMMKNANQESVWLLQGWQASPYYEMIADLPEGEVLVLDLFSESRPKWGTKWSSWYQENGYGKHDWIFCMLHNFGARTGMLGKMHTLIDEYYNAKEQKFNSTLKGIGATMEGIEHDPVMYELLFELPWTDKRFSKEDWVKQYCAARYGSNNKTIEEAWKILANTVYDCPKTSTQEGPTESFLCARPDINVKRVSTFSGSQLYYNADSLIIAAEKMLSVADEFKDNSNFQYDLLDIIRQTVANKAYYLYGDLIKSFYENDRRKFEILTNKYLNLVLAQDTLLNSHSDFMIGNRIEQAKSLGQNKEEIKLYEKNAKTQITLWGNGTMDNISLNDYAYKEKAGILRDYYYVRWKRFFSDLLKDFENKEPEKDYFVEVAQQWIDNDKVYETKAKYNPVEMATYIFNRYVLE